MVPEDPMSANSPMGQERDGRHRADMNKEDRDEQMVQIKLGSTGSDE